VTERPILFSAPMVRAILAGTKTQTRRIVKLKAHTCPYGQAGDRLWVRETWCHQYPHEGAPDRKYVYRADGEEVYGLDAHGHALVTASGKLKAAWIPSIHMPRKASRIMLEVSDVRLQPLHAITESDAIAEGVSALPGLQGDDDLGVYGFLREFERAAQRLGASAPIARYALLWESINGRGSWAANPPVWVVTFRSAP
jgi:hypothetical protein